MLAISELSYFYLEAHRYAEKETDAFFGHRAEIVVDTGFQCDIIMML